MLNPQTAASLPCTADLAWRMICHGREREVVRLTAAMLQQGWRSAACSVSQSACLTGVQAQEIGLVACAGKHWRWRLLLPGRAAGA